MREPLNASADGELNSRAVTCEGPQCVYFERVVPVTAPICSESEVVSSPPVVSPRECSIHGELVSPESLPRFYGRLAVPRFSSIKSGTAYRVSLYRFSVRRIGAISQTRMSQWLRVTFFPADRRYVILGMSKY
jgi:hypothetical protein